MPKSLSYCIIFLLNELYLLQVNVIPIIAKADTLTQDECIRVKKQFLNDIFRHGIKIYEVLNNCCGENKGSINKSLKLRVPFAVVGANTVVEKNGKKFRVRKYPWGIVEVDNLDHCDFLAMRNMITHTHLQKLKDNTNFIHYKKYRLNKLANIYKNLNVCEKEVNDLKVRKEEAEIRQASEANVKDRKQINEDREAELAKMCEMTKNNLKELENLRQKYEVDHEQYEKNEQIFRRRSLNKKECMLCRRY